MSFCMTCGGSVDPMHRFCGNCGAPALANSGAPSTSAPPDEPGAAENPPGLTEGESPRWPSPPPASGGWSGPPPPASWPAAPVPLSAPPGPFAAPTMTPAAPTATRKRGLVIAAASATAVMVVAVGVIAFVAGGGSSSTTGDGYLNILGTFSPVSRAPSAVPKEAWRVRATSPHLLQVGEQLYVGETDERGGLLRRINPTNGQQLWQATLDVAPGGGVDVDGTLIVSGGADTSSTVGLDPKTGTQRWRANGSLSEVGHKRAVITDDQSISVIGARNGAVAARMSSADSVTATALDEEAGTLYVGSDRAVEARKLSDGSVRWRLSAQVASLRSVPDGVVVGEAEGDRARVRFLSARDGKERWSQPSDAGVAVQMTAEGKLLAASSRSAQLLEPRTGTSTAVLGTRSTTLGQILRTDGKELYLSTSSAGSSSGGSGLDLEVIDLAKPGSSAWRTTLRDAGCFAPAQGTVLIGEKVGEDLRVTATRATDGRQLWDVTVRGGGSDCGAAAGTLAVATDEGVVGFR